MQDAPPATDAPPSPRERARAVLRRAGWIAGEGLLSAVVCTVTLLVAYPHLWWLIRARTLVRVTDLYRPGDYGGTLFLIARALEGETGHRSTLLAYPRGFPFGGDFSNQVITDLMSLPVRLLDMPLGYNVSIVGMLATNGMAVYLAARLWKTAVVPSLAGAAIATITPLIAEEVLSGRPVSSWWGPAVAATALCAAAIPSWKRLWLAVPGVLMLGLAIRVYAYAPVLLLPWTALIGLAALWPLDRWKPVRALIVLALAAGVAWWALQEALSAGPSGYLNVQPSLKQHALSIKDITDLGRGGANYQRIPASTMLVALVASAVSWRWARAWLPVTLAATALVVVALGASLYGRGELITVDPRMPYTWLMDHVRYLWGCPRPTRYGMAGGLLVALWMALALGGMWHLKRRAWRWLGRVGAVLAVAAMLYQVKHTDEFAWYPAWPPLPQLEVVEGDRVLVDVPLAFRGDKAILSMVAYARVPRFNPPSAKFRPWWQNLDKGSFPLLTALGTIQHGEEIPAEVMEAVVAGPPEVVEHGLRHVVVHPRQLDQASLARYEALLGAMGATVVSVDDWLAIYELPAD